MPVSENKTRIIVTVEKEIKEKLLKLSKKEQRSLSNMCTKILTDYMQNMEKDGND